jgi:hypothetical protein
VSWHGKSGVSERIIRAMKKETSLGERQTEDRFVHFIDWLNHKLMPAIGPPNVGPYNEVVGQMSEALCPICDRPMAEHTIDHSTLNAVLNCPVEHKPLLVDDEALNELGMPKHKR